ncbi:substrate-binding periplasmic protein [Pseudomonas aeruginosa]
MQARWLALCGWLLGGLAQAAETIRYCDYPVYPPISWSDGQQVRGLAPELVKRLFGALGYRVEVVVLGNWRRCLLDAAAGRVDLILAYRTPARDRDLAFSAESVLREDVAIFYNRQRPVRIRSLGDLAGYRGGLLFGESYGADFDRFVGRHGNVEWVSDSRQNFGKLVRQRIDYIAHERRTGTLFAERLAGGENIRALPEPLTVDYLRVAVSRHSPLAAKMDEIDRALRGYRDDGSIQRWLDDSVRDYRRLAGNRADAW